MKQSSERLWFLTVSLLIIGFSCSEPEQPGRSRTEEGAFTLRLRDREIHYEVHGKGPPLMVVPNSWGITTTALRKLFSTLEEQLTVVYFNPRGMGHSSPIRAESDLGLAAVRHDFRALQEHLELEKVHAIGWSNGALNLIYLASERREALRSAIFVHGAASYSDEDNQAFAEEHPSLVALYQQFEKDMSDPELSDDQKNSRLEKLWLEHLFPMSVADRGRAQDILTTLFAGMPFSWRHAMYSSQESSTFDLTAFLPLITVPALVVAGAHDSIPSSKSAEMVDLLPDARLLVLPESGHFGPLEEPRSFAAAVFSFTGVQGGGSSGSGG